MLTAPGNGPVTLTAGSGPYTLIANHGADTLVGGSGPDTFVFPVLPKSGGQIVNFIPGTDVLNLAPLFTAAHYNGTNPIADHYLTLTSDGKGDTQVFFNPHNGTNGGNPYLVTTIDHVLPTSLVANRDWIFH